VNAPDISLSVNNGGTLPKKQTFTTKKETPEALVIDISIE
jgi:hypothetical protein